MSKACEIFKEIQNYRNNIPEENYKQELNQIIDEMRNYKTTCVSKRHLCDYTLKRLEEDGFLIVKHLNRELFVEVKRAVYINKSFLGFKYTGFSHYETDEEKSKYRDITIYYITAQCKEDKSKEGT